MNDHLPPELLAAYVDGELVPAECRRVEAWLAEHPEARADVEDQRRLLRLVEETAPPAPGDERWASVVDGVWCTVDGAKPASPSTIHHPPSTTRRIVFALAGLAAAAAAVWFSLVFKDPPPAGKLVESVKAEEAWPVLSEDEVDITRMDDRDRDALVVGEPPVNEPLQLLMPDEVQVNNLPVWQGRKGQQYHQPGVPVIVSLGTDPDEDR